MSATPVDAALSTGPTRRQVVAVGVGAAAAGGLTVLVTRGARDVLSGTGGFEVLPTSFGSVRLLGSRRGRRDRVAHETGPDRLGTRLWPDLIRADVEVVNVQGVPVLFSPGQLRLRVGRKGPSVSPLATGGGAGAVAPGGSTRTWVTWRSPGGGDDLYVELTEAGALLPARVRLAPTGAAASPAAHVGHSS